MWNLARPDWEERIVKGESLLPALPDLNREDAARARAIFNMIHLPDVAGQPALAVAAGDWFRDIVVALLGSLVGGQRMIRELFLLAPKKSSKTSYGAALMLTAMLMNVRPWAEFLLIAPTKIVADTAFNAAVGMIEADPERYLKKRFQIQDQIKTITDRRNRAKLMIKTFDTRVLVGVKPVGVLVDELHEIARNRHALRVIGQIRGGLLPNPEGFLAYITTQSDQPPQGVFATELLKARMVRDGKAKASTLAVLYEFPKAMIDDGRWRDPENWWMVTPNRDRSVSIPRLMEEWDSAQLAGLPEMQRWASQHLNVQIGQVMASDNWPGAEFWPGAVQKGLTLGEIIKRSEVLAAGIDGGGLDDLLALAVVGRDRKDPRIWYIWTRAWAHPIVLERRKSEAVKLRDLEKAGDLKFVKKLGTDIEELCGIVQQLDKSGKFHAVGLDPLGVGAIVDALAEHGIEGEKRVIGISQGFRLTGAIKTLERKLADGTARHCGQPLMSYAVGNAKQEPKGNAVLITKQASGTAKIDPLMAVLDAVSIMATNPEAPPDVSGFLKRPVMT